MNDSKYIDETFHFPGQWDVPSHCGLKLVAKDGKTIIIATEMYETNPGSSVTSRVTHLAGEFIRKFAISPDQLMFIVHNPDVESHYEFFQETFDIVHMDWDGEKFGNPSWQRISKEEVDRMIVQ